jgi:hypothetical protein
VSKDEENDVYEEMDLTDKDMDILSDIWDSIEDEESESDESV